MQTAAKRGDLMILVRTSYSWNTSFVRTPYESVRIGVVTSATRDGNVKAWDNPFITKSGPRSIPFRRAADDRVLLVSKDKIDVAAAMAAYRKRVYLGHNQIMDFNSLDEAREFLRPFLRGE